MSDDLYREHIPNIKDIKKCTECNGEIVQDIFQLPKGMKRNGGRLIEAIACDPCKIIFYIFGDENESNSDGR